MQGWQQFYEMIGGAAATLLGLLFVSVSLNAEIILSAEHTHSRRLAEQAFQNYLAVLVLALLVCLPGIGREALGYTVLSVSGVWSVWALVRLLSTLNDKTSGGLSRDVIRRYLGTIVGFGLVAYSGFRLATNTGDIAATMATGTMLLLISATVASWQLLLKIAENRYRERR